MASDQPRRRPPAEPAWQNPADSGNVPITRNRAVAVGLWNDSDFAASPHLTPVSADALRSGGLKLELCAIRPKRDTSKPHPEHKVYPYLLRDNTDQGRMVLDHGI